MLCEGDVQRSILRHRRHLCLACAWARHHAMLGPSPLQDKKVVSCRQDWHQTSSQVVVTVYAKNPLPALSSVKANRTVVSGASRAGLGMQAFTATDFDEPTGQLLRSWPSAWCSLMARLVCCSSRGWHCRPAIPESTESLMALLLPQRLPSHSGSVAFSLSGWLCWP